MAKFCFYYSLISQSDKKGIYEIQIRVIQKTGKYFILAGNRQYKHGLFIRAVLQ